MIMGSNLLMNAPRLSRMGGINAGAMLDPLRSFRLPMTGAVPDPMRQFRTPPTGGVSPNNSPQQASPAAMKQSKKGLLGSGSRVAQETPKLTADEQSQDEAPPSWAEGGKLRFKDGLGLVLGGIGDGIAQHNGGQAWAVRDLLEQRESALSAGKLAQAEAAKRQSIGDALRSQGFDDNQIEVALTNPEALGANYNERFGTRSVADGTHVVTGGPGGQESAFYQRDVPDFEQYAETMGLKPGSEEYFSAVQDYVLRSNGPTAFGRDQQMDAYRTDNDIRLEELRQGNRVSLEDIRQGNRVGLKQIPSPARATTATAPRFPTATGPDGRKVMWNGQQWVPAQ